MQFFAVVRHEERADALDAAFVCGKHWCKSEDFRRWPSDPPLSDIGLSRAGELGHRLGELSKECGAKVHIVLSSPYHRCVQTATAICQKLGHGTPLLVDLSLGEVFGPSILGESEPKLPCVRFQERYSQDANFKTAGQWPVWPETLDDARLRYAKRFLKYLKRSRDKCWNFVMVTHGDGVASALRVMPSMTRDIHSIGTGGMFSAKRCNSEVNAPGTNVEVGIYSSRDLLGESKGWELQLEKISLAKAKSDELTTRRTLKGLVLGLQDSPFGLPRRSASDDHGDSAVTWSFLLQPEASVDNSEEHDKHMLHMLRHIDDVDRTLRSSVQRSDSKAKYVLPPDGTQSCSSFAGSSCPSRPLGESSMSLTSSLLLRRRASLGTSSLSLSTKETETEEIIVRV